MPKFDSTKLNVAIDKLLETTEKPRHRFLLQSYSRHRCFEIAGRYEEIFAQDMNSMDPSTTSTQAAACGGRLLCDTVRIKSGAYF